jgi:signal transduction histidine kinase
LALSAIALVAIVGQVLIQLHLHHQLTDSEVVNVAGRQRMLSQRITKDILRLTVDPDTVAIHDLRSSTIEWKRSQQELQRDTNTPKVKELFQSIERSHQLILMSADSALAQFNSAGVISVTTLRSAQVTILENETIFLEGMDAIVEQYAIEARDRVTSLSRMEYVLVGISLLVIFLEIAFVFQPTARHVSQAVDKLTDSEKNALKLSKEIGALYASLEKSYQQMAVINQPIDNPRLFAKADRGGNVTFVSDQLKAITQKTGGADERRPRGLKRFSDLFPSMKDPDEWMDDMIERVSDGHSWRGELAFVDNENKERWIDVIITPVYGEQQGIEELVMAGSDITHHKVAEKSMLKKNMAEIEKTINQQKFRSVLILEGQEEERKRIAMDIHDGIGQMLTSLKFQIESIDLKNETQAEKKISEIEHMIKDVIREVRKVTFNLKPPVLGDYGLQAGLNVFITEIGKLTNIDLALDAKGEVDRLPQKIENNIFRIIQEAINNAIKYSDAPKIEVILRQSPSEIVATVRDEGRGFDTRIVDARSVNIESGRGFFNMYERTEYVNGHLEISSVPGKGTTVELRVPLHYDTANE